MLCWRSEVLSRCLRAVQPADGPQQGPASSLILFPTAAAISYFGANPDDSCWRREQCLLSATHGGRVLDAAHGPNCS